MNHPNSAPYNHEETLVEGFKREPEFAAEYLSQVLADGSQAEVLETLRFMTKAFGGVVGVAGKAQLNVTSLYRTLSPTGNPELKSLTALLKAMGLQLAVKPIEQLAHS
jgi:probable addiction module antidote protein